MTWWNEFVNWLSSTQGSRIVTDAILPFVAIVVAGVVAALIARSMGRRLLAAHEREAASAAVTSVITAARKATAWSTLGGEEREFAAHLRDESTVRLRLLPTAGAGQAAAWAEHEIAAIAQNSSTFTFQAEQTFADVRDRLVEWQAKLARARKLFRHDLERWQVEEDGAVTAGAGRSGGAAGSPGVEPSADAPATSGVPAATSAVATSTADHGGRPRLERAADQVAAPLDESARGRVEAPVDDRSSLPSTSAERGDATGVADDTDFDDEADRVVFSAPVSAGQVRRRTSPDAD